MYRRIQDEQRQSQHQQEVDRYRFRGYHLSALSRRRFGQPARQQAGILGRHQDCAMPADQVLARRRRFQVDDDAPLLHVARQLQGTARVEVRGPGVRTARTRPLQTLPPVKRIVASLPGAIDARWCWCTSASTKIVLLSAMW